MTRYHCSWLFSCNESRCCVTFLSRSVIFSNCFTSKNVSNPMIFCFCEWCASGAWSGRAGPVIPFQIASRSLTKPVVTKISRAVDPARPVTFQSHCVILWAWQAGNYLNRGNSYLNRGDWSVLVFLGMAFVPTGHMPGPTRICRILFFALCLDCLLLLEV